MLMEYFQCRGLHGVAAKPEQSSNRAALICRYVSRGEGGRGLYEENIVVKARLILHFDINKTVLMSDKAQGANTDHMVNVLLSECAWGRLEPGPKWVPVGRLATDRSPCASPSASKYPHDPRLTSLHYSSDVRTANTHAYHSHHEVGARHAEHADEFEVHLFSGKLEDVRMTPSAICCAWSSVMRSACPCT